MDRELFKEKFQTLCDLFNVSKPIDKAKIYYSVLSKYSDSSLEKVVHDIIHQKDRLPSIFQFLEMLRSKENFNQGKAECDYCNGFGYRLSGRFVYKAACSHSASVPKYVAQFPGSEIARMNEASDWEATYGKGSYQKQLNLLI